MTRRRLAILIAASVLLASTSALGGRPSKRLSDEERGALLYGRHCIQCHGASSAGDGPASAALVRKVPDLRGKLTEANREAEADVVLFGRDLMPGFEGTFDRYDALRVLRTMETLPEKPWTDAAPPKPGSKGDEDEDIDAAGN
jgi:mono/diheme cytochrome c family protein